MKISSYFARLKAERWKFKTDYYKVLTSFRYRPNNWKYRHPYVFENASEGMEIWVGNKLYGFHFFIKGKKYFDNPLSYFAEIFPFAFGWRRKMYNEVMWHVHNSSHIKKTQFTGNGTQPYRGKNEQK